MNTRILSAALLVLVAFFGAKALIPSARAAVAEGDQAQPRVALLDLTIVDDYAAALPGITVEARVMGGGKDAETFVAITNADGRCSLPVSGGAAHLVTASLEGFSPVRLLAVEVAGGFAYQVPELAMGIGEGEPRDHVWSELLAPIRTYLDDDSEFGEWLDEQPDEVAAALLTPRCVRVHPLPRDLDVILNLSIGDWDELAGAAVTLLGEDHRYFAFTDDYGACRILLDRPGRYTMRIQHPSIGSRQITDIELRTQRAYIIDTLLGNKETTWAELVADGDAYAMGLSGEWVDLEEE